MLACYWQQNLDVQVMANSNIKISWFDVKQSEAMLCNLFLGELSMH